MVGRCWHCQDRNRPQYNNTRICSSRFSPAGLRKHPNSSAVGAPDSHWQQWVWVHCPASAMGSHAGSHTLDSCQNKKIDINNSEVLKPRTEIQKLHSVAALRLYIYSLFTINAKVWWSQVRKRNPSKLSCADKAPWLGCSCSFQRGMTSPVSAYPEESDREFLPKMSCKLWFIAYQGTGHIRAG